MLNAPPLSLKHRVLGAGIWSLSGYGLSQIIRLGGNLLVTRLLVPDMFGVMAIANIVMTGLALFSDVGLLPNVVQNVRGNDPAFLNTAWAIQILRGAVLWLVALAISACLLAADRFGLFGMSSVYGDPRLPFVLSVSSFTAVLGGIQSTKILEAGRNLALGRVTQIDIIAQIVGLICIVAWAGLDRSIWALVVGGIFAALTKTALSHAWLQGNHNRWEWDKAAFNEIIHFGKWIFVSSILGFLAINGDRLLLGSFIDSTILGIYIIASFMVNSIDQILGRIIVDVSFPALSEISRDRPEALKTSYRLFHTVVASVSYLCAGTLMTFGPTLINLLYDRRYHQAGWMLQIIAFILLAEPFRLGTQSFLIYGAARVYSQIHAIRLIALLLFIPAGFYLSGLPGALWGYVLSLYSAIPTVIHVMKRHGLFDVKRELAMAPFLFCGMLSGCFLVYVSAHFR